MSKRIKCPCCSKIDYQDCCKKYHDGKLAENALHLMRSRYSAFALYVPEYIIKTTHPLNKGYIADKKAWSRQIQAFSRETRFENLEIIEFIDGPKIAFVTFLVQFTSGGKKAAFTEKSRFEKVNGEWLYLDGQVASC